MPSCAFLECSNNTKNSNKDSGITFHAFPTEIERKEKWIKIVRKSRRDDYWMWSKFSRICSDHFLDNEIYLTKKGNHKIHKTAVPKILEQQRKTNCPSTILCTVHYGTQENNEQQQRKGSDSPSSSISVPSSVFDSPKKAGLKERVRKFNFKDKNNKLTTVSLKQKNQRLQKKCTTLKSIVQSLQKNNMITADSLQDLELKAESAEFINRIYLNRKGKSSKRNFPPALRKFALTLHFNSASAYTYVRRVFSTALPHPKTLRKWYENSNIEPGFTAQAFEMLKVRSKATGKRLTCTLVANEMAIRQQTQWNGKKITGLVDYGIGQTDIEEIATQVYVLILVCNDENWKIPVGYFFINGLPGSRRASLIKTCLEKCNDIGVDVIALTFDGCAANLTAAKILGCKLQDVNNLVTTFKHPSNESHVAVFLDPCHMLKLVRNTFEAKRILYDGTNNKIQWHLLANLVKLQEGEGLHLGNKLTHRHIQFRHQIMKVKMAVQLMSTSVSKALRMCNSMSIPTFNHVEPTANFIEKFNNLFDILNSRQSGKHDFKKPICKESYDSILRYLNEMESYIKSLKINNIMKSTFKKKVSYKTTPKDITQCKCNTGFKGFLICIKSLQHLYDTLVDTNRLSYIATYKISQDHVELLFGLQRSHGGNNNNPNAIQFRGIYRKLFNHMQLRSPFSGNCVPLDNYQILTSSASQALNESTPKNFKPDSTEMSRNSITETDLLLETNASALAALLDSAMGTDVSEMCQYIVGYIAGYVARQLTKTVKCETCVSSLLCDEKLEFHKLIELKTIGGLAFPSKDLYSVCLRAEKCISNYIKQKATQIFFPTENITLLNGILKSFLSSTVFSELLTSHTFDHHATLSHRNLLLKTIIEKYITVRLHHLHKNDPAIKKHTKRQKRNKMVLFEGS